MSLKLSYRDKVIFIVVMVILVIIAGFFVFIKPKFEKVNSAKDTLAAKQQEKIDIDTKIGTLPDIIDNMKATAEEIGEKQKIFLDEGHPYVNETYIREILSGLNLDIKSMNTTYTTASTISRYTIEKLNYLAYDNKMNADLYNELPQEVYDLYNGVAAPVYPNTIIGVTKMSVEVDIGNNTRKIYDIMDRLAEDEKTIILNSLSTEREPENTDEASASLNLTLYSIFPLNVEEVLKETDEVKPIEPAVEETAEPAA